MEACELAAEGMGHPSFFNCEGLYAMLEHRAGGPEGYSNYTRKDILKFGSPIGCVEPGAEGLQYGHTDSGIINVAGATLMAVTNGIMPEGTDNMFAGKLLTAVVMPAMFPVPTVPARAVETAWKGVISPSPAWVL